MEKVTDRKGKIYCWTLCNMNKQKGEVSPQRESNFNISYQKAIILHLQLKTMFVFPKKKILLNNKKDRCLYKIEKTDTLC